jgi:alanine-glyoxylate transaminase/(R)-3-amino-2-methylpropionate-pyruvate transaminase
MNTPELPPCDHLPEPYKGPPYDEVLRLKNRYLTPTSVPFYTTPLMIVEGSMQYLFDEKGRRYLDAIGGIVTISVGHCHPYVVQKVKEQMQRLQHITSIYLHPNAAMYAEMLAGKLPGDLSVCYFMNSGSEANDMALLMARLYTGNTDVIALQNAYHGGGASTMQLTANSAWKYNTPHHFGVHHAINPNPYRGLWGYDDPDAGAKYAAEIKNVIDYATPGRVAAFIAESIQGVGGAVVYPDGFLKKTYGYCRRGADRFHTNRDPLLGFRKPRRHSRYRHHGQRDRQRRAPGGCRDDAWDRRCPLQPDSLQHLRRKSRFLRSRHGRSGGHRPGKPPEERSGEGH